MTRTGFVQEKFYIRDELVQMGDFLIQATGRARKVLEMMPDDL